MLPKVPMLVLLQSALTALLLDKHLSVDAFGEVQHRIAFFVFDALALSAVLAAFGIVS